MEVNLRSVFCRQQVLDDAKQDLHLTHLGEAGQDWGGVEGFDERWPYDRPSGVSSDRFFGLEDIGELIFRSL